MSQILGFIGRRNIGIVCCSTPRQPEVARYHTLYVDFVDRVCAHCGLKLLAGDPHVWAWPVGQRVQKVHCLECCSIVEIHSLGASGPIKARVLEVQKSAYQSGSGRRKLNRS